MPMPFRLCSGRWSGNGPTGYTLDASAQLSTKYLEVQSLDKSLSIGVPQILQGGYPDFCPRTVLRYCGRVPNQSILAKGSANNRVVDIHLQRYSSRRGKPRESSAFVSKYINCIPPCTLYRDCATLIIF